MKGNLKEYLKTYQLRENETFIKGMVYCTNCGGKKLVIVAKDEFYHCSCPCLSEAYHKREEQREKEKRLRYLETLKNDSLLYDKYKNFTFDKFDLDRPESIINAYNFCKEYCTQIFENIKTGKGIYLYGESNGTGKTILTICIANFALEQYIPTLFTSMYEIMRTLKSVYDKHTDISEDAYIEKLSNIELLILDDFGTELKSKNNDFFNDIVFQILDKRLKNRRATIFTSNLGLNELVNKGLTRRNAERILEICLKNFFKLSGKSYRLKLLENA